MKLPEKKTALQWARRGLIYLVGLFSIALGIAFSARSGLGVSPVGSPANVLYQIGLDRGLPERIFNLGNWTFALYCVYILAQILLLGRQYKPLQLLQVAVSYLFGFMVNLTCDLLSVLPDPGSYAVRMLYLLISIPFVGLGVMLYLRPRLLPTPGEGTILAMTQRWGITVPTGKTIFDCTVVSLAVLLSLLYFRSFVGVREGTVISALLTGFAVRFFQKLLLTPVDRFLWGNTPPEDA